MKNRTLIIMFASASVVLVLSVVGYLMNRSSVTKKSGASFVDRSEERTSGKPDAVSTAPSDSAKTQITSGLSLADGNAKLYENSKYGFSLLMPKDYWYEETDMTMRDIGPVFSIAIERPGLPSEEMAWNDGKTAMSKYGILMSISICDRRLSRGKCLVDGKIDGMDFERQVSTTVGGHTAQKFDDRAYAVVTDIYEYEITLNPRLSDFLSVADMEGAVSAFEDVVKTVRFK
ncbi:MAG: hypothetical protein HGA33_01685 [Candidatus Moranbacteria bacterium]|nr:hypothetical protein [Candidatus Moranbacteria bacterium]